MADTLDELLIGLGYDYDDKGVAKFKKDLDSALGVAEQFVKAITVGAAAVFGFTVATTAATDAQGKFAEETDVAVGDIDALSFALGIAGGKADSTGESISQFGLRISEAARGTGSGVEALGMLGLTATDTNGELKPTVGLLFEISEAMEGLDKRVQVELADKLGLSGMIRLLQQGPGAMRELTDEARLLGVITEEDAVLSAEFQDQLTRVWAVMKSISRTITKELAPTLSTLLEKATEWWKLNKDLIESKMPDWIDKVSRGIKVLAIAAIAFISVRLVSAVWFLVKGFKALAVAAMLANVAVGLIPALVVTAVAGLALLISDAEGFFNGQSSFIGDMLEKYPEWANVLMPIVEAFRQLVDWSGLLHELWKDIFNLFKGEFSFPSIDKLIGNDKRLLDKLFGDLPGVKRSGSLKEFFGFGQTSSIDNSISNSRQVSSRSLMIDTINVTAKSSDAKSFAIELGDIIRQSSQSLDSSVVA